MADTYQIRIGGGVDQSLFSSVDKLRNSLASTSLGFGGLASSAAKFFSVYKLFQIGKDAISAADDLNKFSQEVGIGVSSLSKLKYAADLSDVGDHFRQGMIKFSGVIADAADKSSKASKIFAAMNVEVAGRATDQILLDIADRYKSYADGANKAALTEELFGTKHVRFIALLNGGRSGLQAVGDDLERIGGVVDAQKAQQAEEFNDSLTRLNAQFKGIAISIGTEILPSLTGLVNAFTTTTTGSNTLAPALWLVSKAIQAIAMGATYAYGIIEYLGTVLGQTAAAMVDVAKLNFSGASLIMKQLGKDLDELQQKRYDAIDRIRNPIPALVGANVLSGKAQAPNIAASAAARRDEIDGLKEAYRVEQDRIALEREKVRVSFELTDVQKRGRELELIDQETKFLSLQIDLLKQKRDLTSDENLRAKYDQQINNFEDKQRNLGTQRIGISDQANPESVRDQLVSARTSLINEFGTVAQNIGRGFKDVIGGAVQSVSSGITGLIMRTKTWRQALMEVGASILTSVVQAVVQLGVRWVATQILMAVAGKAIQASATAATAPIAAAQAAIWAAPATLATIASFGGAAIAAPGFIASANALTLAQSLGSLAAFESGGLTPGIPSLAMVGEGGPEYVLSAPATRAFGTDFLDKMNRGEVAPGPRRGNGGGATNVQVSFINDRQDEREFQARDGWKITADKLRRRGVRGA